MPSLDKSRLKPGRFNCLCTYFIIVRTQKGYTERRSDDILIEAIVESVTKVVKTSLGDPIGNGLFGGHGPEHRQCAEIWS